MVDSISKNKSSNRQSIVSKDNSTISDIAQSQINGNVCDSIVATASGNVTINYYKYKSNELNHIEIRKKYIQGILSSEKFSKWGDCHYINEYICPLPIDLPPTDLSSIDKKSLIKQKLISSVQDSINKKEKILILGKPGSGKTTSLEHIIYSYISHKIDDNDTPLPIFLSLNRYNGNLLDILKSSISEFTKTTLNKKQIKILIDNVRCIFFFDGLNELGKEREKGIREINNFTSLYSEHNYVLTCRTQEYDNTIDIDKCIEIQPLEKKDIETYLSIHLGDKGKILYNKLNRNKNLNKDNRLLELARNPLMLQMIKEAGIDGELPTSRGQLYHSFIRRSLWREGKKGEKARSIPGRVKERVLAILGYEMQSKNILIIGEYNLKEIFVSYLEKWNELYNWRTLLEEIDLNGLLKLSGDKWEFMHQSIQEFFAAYHIEDQEKIDEIVNKIIGKPQWNEVIWLLSGLTTQSSKLIKNLLNKDPFMAAKAISQSSLLNKELVQLVINKLGEIIIHNENWTIRRTCCDLMEEISSPLAYPYLKGLLSDENQEVRWGAIHAIRLIGIKDGVEEELLKSLDDPFDIARGEAAMTVGELGIISALSKFGSLLGANSAYVRVSATYGLVQLLTTTNTNNINILLEHESFPVRQLSDFALNVVQQKDKNEFIRKNLSSKSFFIQEASLMLLVRANYARAIPNVACLLSSESSSIRSMAIVSLGNFNARDYSDEIAEIMLNDKIEEVRASAAGALETMGAENVNSQLLQATNDDSPKVRFVVARNLGRMKNIDSRSQLKILSKDDPDQWVRIHAIRAIGFLGINGDKKFLRSLYPSERTPEVIQCIREAIDNITKGDRKLRF